MEKKMTEEAKDTLIIPDEIKRDLLDIIADNPTLVKVGGSQYKVYNLRAYSLNRIFKVAVNLRLEDKEIDNDKKLLYALSTDIEASSEILAICLVNHLFTPPSEIRSFEEAVDTMDRNDKLVYFMKTKVLNEVIEPNAWAAIILGCIQSIDLSTLFFCTQQVSRLMDSQLNKRQKVVEAVSLWKQLP